MSEDVREKENLEHGRKVKCYKDIHDCFMFYYFVL